MSGRRPSKYDLSAAPAGKSNADRQRRMARKRSNLFAGLNAQIRLAMKIAAANSADGLRKIFEKFDTDGNNQIDKEEFFTGVTLLGVKISKEEIDMMWPYFDFDNSGAIDMEEFMLFAEGKLGDRKTEQKGTFITQGDVADHLDQATLKSLAKAQRPVLSQLEEEERKPSLATDEKVQSILERPVWSLQHMRQKVKLLPLPDPSYLKHQEWMWDDNKPIPKSSVREAPMRDWRSSFFEQIKCDSKLRIEMKNLKPVHGGIQKREAWGRYKNERKHIFETQLKKEAERHAKIQRDIQELEKAAKQIEELEEKKRAALGLM